MHNLFVTYHFMYTRRGSESPASGFGSSVVSVLTKSKKEIVDAVKEDLLSSLKMDVPLQIVLLFMQTMDDAEVREWNKDVTRTPSIYLTPIEPETPQDRLREAMSRYLVEEAGCSEDNVDDHSRLILSSIQCAMDDMSLQSAVSLLNLRDEDL